MGRGAPDSPSITVGEPAKGSSPAAGLPAPAPVPARASCWLKADPAKGSAAGMGACVTLSCLCCHTGSAGQLSCCAWCHVGCCWWWAGAAGCASVAAVPSQAAQSLAASEVLRADWALPGGWWPAGGAAGARMADTWAGPPMADTWASPPDFYLQMQRAQHTCSRVKRALCRAVVERRVHCMGMPQAVHERLRRLPLAANPSCRQHTLAKAGRQLLGGSRWGSSLLAARELEPLGRLKIPGSPMA